MIEKRFRMSNEKIIKEYNIALKECPSWSEDDELNTYQGWLKDGRQVIKGSKARSTLKGRGVTWKNKKPVYYDKTIYLFTRSQTKEA